MKSIPSHFHKVIDLQLPDHIFIYPERNKPKSLQTIFVYFQKLDKPRPKPKRFMPNEYWRYVSPSEPKRNADFRVIRTAGKVGTCVRRISKNFKIKGRNDYYIKVLSPHSQNDLKKICEKISNAKFEYNNVSKTLLTLNKNQLTKKINTITKNVFSMNK